MKFTYQARTKEGKVEAGAMEAYSAEAVAALLQKKGLFVTTLVEQKEQGRWLKYLKILNRVSRKELAVFFRQLSIMIESQVPIVQSLYGLAEQAQKQTLKEALFNVAKAIEEGSQLSEALGAYPDIFSAFYINLLRSGEVSGNVSKILYYISDHLEKEDEIISQVKQAFAYPAFVLVVLVIVVGVIIVEVMPRITNLIQATDSTPSNLTVAILGFYTFLENYWWILALLMFIAVALVVRYLRTEQGRAFYDTASLKIPAVKNLLKKVFLVRFCSNISTLLIAGVSIDRALQIAESTVDNAAYKKVVAEVGADVAGGNKISAAMITHKDYFPPFVIQMVDVGERTGKLDKVLLEVVNFYQKDVKRSLELFSKLLEPAMIIILGGVVALLAMSVLSSLYGALGGV